MRAVARVNRPEAGAYKEEPRYPTTAVGEETEVADADEATRQHMQQRKRRKNSSTGRVRNRFLFL